MPVWVRTHPQPEDKPSAGLQAPFWATRSSAVTPLSFEQPWQPCPALSSPQLWEALLGSISSHQGLENPLQAPAGCPSQASLFFVA